MDEKVNVPEEQKKATSEKTNVSEALDPRLRWGALDAYVMAATFACKNAKAAVIAGLYKLLICTHWSRRLRAAINRHRRGAPLKGFQATLSPNVKEVFSGMDIQWSRVPALSAGQCLAFKRAFEGAHSGFTILV
ncbi:Hypothetical predicted protein [Cloeon dipterum]|uniref:Uncharacterized protein n=1 Tax=Cloeon dipterum TaxID=197152 RepID=A0A8S1DIH3_9INSE|nr:Hypothetical predicted protein [Cloeon dipterum]